MTKWPGEASFISVSGTEQSFRGLHSGMESASWRRVEKGLALPFQDDVFPLRFPRRGSAGTAERSARVYGWSGEW